MSFYYGMTMKKLVSLHDSWCRSRMSTDYNHLHNQHNQQETVSLFRFKSFSMFLVIAVILQLSVQQTEQKVELENPPQCKSVPNLEKANEVRVYVENCVKNRDGIRFRKRITDGNGGKFKPKIQTKRKQSKPQGHANNHEHSSSGQTTLAVPKFQTFNLEIDQKHRFKPSLHSRQPSRYRPRSNWKVSKSLAKTHNKSIARLG